MLESPLPSNIKTAAFESDWRFGSMPPKDAMKRKSAAKLRQSLAKIDKLANEHKRLARERAALQKRIKGLLKKK